MNKILKKQLHSIKCSMHLYFILLLLFSFSVNVGYAKVNNRTNRLNQQDERIVTLEIKDKPIRFILNEIKRQVGLDYVIKDNANPNNKLNNLSISVKNVPLKQALETLLKGTNFTYRINKNIIYLEPTQAQAVSQENALKKISGTILDTDQKPLPGAVILIKGTSIGTTSGPDGRFTLNVTPGSILRVSFIGYQTESVKTNKETNNLVVVLKQEVQNLEDAVVVAFGTQKKESVVSSITTVTPRDLKSSSSDLTTQFAGKIAGMVGWQTGGLPGALTEDEMNTKFYIRGITSFQTGANKDPLILLDGVETSKLDLSRIATEDIESFSVMKDASAAAMYGARGANGVILVTTKKGKEGDVYASFRYETVFSNPTKDIDVVDPLDYMFYYNQALMGRSTSATPKYTQEYINRTKSGKYPDFLYPQNDWYNIMFKDYSLNHRAGLSLRGGSRTIQYYASFNYNQDNGMLKTDRLNQFKVNITNNQYGFRTNLNVNLKSGIRLLINSSATLDKYHGPLTSMQQAYGLAFAASPVDYAALYPGDEEFAWPHLRFGGLTEYTSNPYMELHKGYLKRTRYSFINKAEYIHDLGKFIKGLELRASISWVTSGYFSTGYKTKPFMYALFKDNYDFETGIFHLTPLNQESAQRTLSVDSQNTGSTTDSRTAYEVRVLHTAAWKDHQTSLTGVLQLQERQTTPVSSVLNGIPNRNLTFSMRGTYGYKDRYFIEGSFGYNGSERFPKDNRMGFFPAGGIAWVVSNEKFMLSSSRFINFLKFRASYGKVGNDGIISSPRYIYLPSIGTVRGYNDPSVFNKPFERYAVASYANPTIQWEIAEKVNLGLETKFFNGLVEMNFDAFQEIRHNIIANRTVIPASMGLEQAPLANIGKARSRGFDCSAKIQHAFNNDFWIILNGTATYNRAKYLEIEEAYGKPQWQLRKGHEISQNIGYIAEGLFSDQAEIDNSPVQGGDIMPGDIRYRDLNNDGVIDVEDATYIGFPETPRLTYGFSAYINYKGFELNFSFQGSGKRSFFLNPQALSPFDNDNAMLKAIANDHWSDDHMTNKPLWPRLAVDNLINHNPQEDWYNKDASEIRKSTYFMRECSFLRCTSIEFAYNLPQSLMKKWNMQNFKFFVRANNPFIITNFKIWDVELGENGFNYPIQKMYALGLNFSF